MPLAQADGVPTITDDGRIRASLPTIESLTARGARVIVTAHLGRPKGQVDPALSLAPVAGRMAELLGRPVGFVPDLTGAAAQDAVAALQDGDVLVLENVRFDPRETSKDPSGRRHWRPTGVDGRPLRQ